MLPFQVELRGGVSVHQQVIYAVRKAVVAGRLRPGDRFPSVRHLSVELRINPNTAHKVVSALVGEGLLEVHPGVGTIVAVAHAATAEELRKLLEEEVERIVVESKKHSLGLEDLLEAVTRHWRALDEPEAAKGSTRRREQRSEKTP